METVKCNVRDLPENDRSALERVVGHELREGEQTVIQVVKMPLDETANLPAVSSEITGWCNIYYGLSDAEIDELDRLISRSPLNRELS